MTLLVLGSGFLLAFATTLLIVPVIARAAVRRGWVDNPDAIRKLHARATPTLGGTAIIAGALVGLLYLVAVRAWLPFELALPPIEFWLGAALMLGAGVYDDIHGVGFKAKLGIQILAAYLLLHAGFRVEVADLPFATPDLYEQALYSIPLTLLWVVGVVNAVNLIDGIDGLAGGVVMIAFACLSIIFGLGGGLATVVLALMVIGAVAGFLVHNFNPASIFMGDSGSLTLGYILAAYALEGQGHTDPVVALIIPVVALGLPIIDTGLSIFRRLQARRSVYAPDSDHIHHRMTRLLPTRRAVLVLYVVSAGFGVVAILMALSATVVGFGYVGLALAAAGLGLRRLGYFRSAAPAAKVVDVEPLGPPVSSDTRPSARVHSLRSDEAYARPGEAVAEEAPSRADFSHA